MIERYTLPEMGALWSEQNRFQKWLDVEIAVCEVHAEMGTIPEDALEQIKAVLAIPIQKTDMRATYRLRPGRGSTVDLNFELFNIFNNWNFANPTSDQPKHN